MTEHRTPHFGHTATGAPVHRETRHYRLPHVHETPTTRWR